MWNLTKGKTFLSGISTELNPTEQCWKPARKKLANRLLKTLPAAKYHLKMTFKNKSLMPKMYDYL